MRRGSKLFRRRITQALTRSDLYALGATLHRVLTHHDAATNKPDLFTFPPVRSLRPDISPGFEQVIMKALAPLKQRWSDATEIEQAIIALPPVTETPPAGPVAGAADGTEPAIPRPSNPQTPNNMA